MLLYGVAILLSKPPFFRPKARWTELHGQDLMSMLRARRVSPAPQVVSRWSILLTPLDPQGQYRYMEREGDGREFLNFMKFHSPPLRNITYSIQSQFFRAQSGKRWEQLHSQPLQGLSVWGDGPNTRAHEALKSLQCQA